MPFLTVFPTHVGVFLRHTISFAALYRLPHARGGVSRQGRRWRNSCSSSPRTWGCFSQGLAQVHKVSVFPTHVGVFLDFGRIDVKATGLPHARGGVSDLFVEHDGLHGSSPRTWGCFRPQGADRTAPRVFPTHVGVFLYRAQVKALHERLPHARGVFQKSINYSILNKKHPYLCGVLFI